MKKILSILIIGCVFSDVAFAFNCDSSYGEIIEGKISGRFCKSKQLMNVWSAYTWCDSIGGKMAEFSTLCPGTTLSTSSTCKNFPSGMPYPATSNYNVWVFPNASKSTSSHYRVNLTNGKIQETSRNRPIGAQDDGGNPITDMFAICE